MGKKKEEENNSKDEFGFHPKDWLLNKWETIKWIFLSIVIIGIFFDLFGNHPFDSSSSCFLVRCAIAIVAIFLFMLLLGIEYIWFKKREKNKWSEDEEELKYDNKKWEHAIDIYRHTDRLYHHRFNFFLVAESMLIVSFVTTLLINPNNINEEYANYIRVAIAILGLVYTFSWFYVNKKLDWRLVFLTHKYLKRNPEFNDYLGSIDKIAKIHNGFFMSSVLPTFTFAFWYFLFYIARWKLI